MIVTGPDQNRHAKKRDDNAEDDVQSSNMLLGKHIFSDFVKRILNKLDRNGNDTLGQKIDRIKWVKYKFDKNGLRPAPTLRTRLKLLCIPPALFEYFQGKFKLAAPRRVSVVEKTSHTLCSISSKVSKAADGVRAITTRSKT
jgi:hypothetical protein